MEDRMTCPVVLIGAFLLVVLLWGGLGGGMMGYWNGSMMGGSLLLLNVLFWVGIIVLVWWAITKLVRREKPLEVLDRRYAAGEIGRTEYLRTKHEISK